MHLGIELIDECCHGEFGAVPPRLVEHERKDVLIVTVGPMAKTGLEVAERLAAQGIGSTVIDLTSRNEDAFTLSDGYQPIRHRLGILYDDPAPTFDSAVIEQNAAAAEGKKPDLQALLSRGQTWMVDKQPHLI